MKATKTEIAMEIITGAGKAVLESRVTRGIAIVHSYFDLGKDTVKRINNNELKENDECVVVVTAELFGIYYMLSFFIGNSKDIDFLKYSIALPIATNVLSGIYRISKSIPNVLKRAEERVVQKKLSLEGKLAQSGALSEVTEVPQSGSLTYATQGGELSLLDRLRINSDASNPYLQQKQKQEQ